MKKMSRPELIAKNIVDCAYEIFVNPGKFAGNEFNKDNFEIEKWIKGSFSLSYMKNPPKKSLDRAINFGKNYWKELLNGKS